MTETQVQVRTLQRGSATHWALRAVAVAMIVAAVVYASTLGPFRLGQLTNVMIFAIAISGLNLATGYTGMLSIGHSAFFGLGAYTTAVLVVTYDWAPLSTLPVAVLLNAVVGFLVGLPALRIRGLYLALVTLAIGVAFPELVKRFEDTTGGAAGIVVRRSMLTPPSWSGFSLGERPQWMFWLCLVFLLLVLLLISNLVNSRLGLAMRATRDNEIAAASSGVHLAVVKTSVFALSAAVTGLAGSLFAMYLGALSPDGSFTLLLSITLITGLIVGGAATRTGPILGGLAVVYIPYYSSNLSQGPVAGIVFGVALIAIVFLMPHGIVGGLRSLAARVVRIVPGPVTPGAPGAPASVSADGFPPRRDRDLDTTKENPA